MYSTCLQEEANLHHHKAHRSNHCANKQLWIGPTKCGTGTVPILSIAEVPHMLLRMRVAYCYRNSTP